MNRPGEDSAMRSPVVGWLVCTRGHCRGQDFRIIPGRNRIGREDTNEISIDGDGQISREAHAELMYDSKRRVFYLLHKNGKNLTYRNDDPVLAPCELTARDRIEIGSTEFLFIPLCGPHFHWGEWT